MDGTKSTTRSSHISQNRSVFESIIFDFDGLILDTETPLYVAWAQTYETYGVEPIPLVDWAESLGLHDDDPAMLDPHARLESEIGRELPRRELQKVRRRFRDELLEDLAIRDGVVDLLDEASGRGLSVGIASSSPPDWIERHLEPRGLLESFTVISCAGDGVPGKPNPAVYLEACRRLEADPRRSLALEDSPNGAMAAKAAGMTCVAVPTDVSRNLDFGHVDHVLASLAELRLDEVWGATARPEST